MLFRPPRLSVLIQVRTSSRSKNNNLTGCQSTLNFSLSSSFKLFFCSSLISQIVKFFFGLRPLTFQHCGFLHRNLQFLTYFSSVSFLKSNQGRCLMKYLFNFSHITLFCCCCFSFLQ